MRGLSTRNYGAVVKDFHNAYGIEKSAVSENFIEASREKVKQLMERPLGELRLCAIVIDGTPFKDRQMIVALGIGCDGRKTVLGIREGATENTAVVSTLLSELVERGLDFSTSAAVHPGWRQSAGRRGAEACRRGSLHPALPGPQETQCRRSLAGRTQSRREAETAERLRDGGLRRGQACPGPSASRADGSQSQRGAQPGRRYGRNAHRSQVARAGPTPPDFVLHQRDRVGLLHRRNGLPQRQTLADGDQIERWVGSGLLVAERQFRKVIGHRQIPLLLSSMANAVSKKSIAKGAAVA